MISHDALIRDLSGRLSPVNRRSALEDATLLLVVGAVELALFLLSLNLMWPDMVQMVSAHHVLWKLGGLLCLFAISSAAAVRSFSPVAPRRRWSFALVVAGAAMVTGALFAPGHEGTMLDRLSPLRGMMCSLSILALSLPMMGVLAVLMRRGAPVHPERSALAAGLAAASWGALVFAFCCPIKDPLYVVIWYLVGCFTVTIVSRWLLPKGFRL
jgi:hypothetical protein